MGQQAWKCNELLDGWCWLRSDGKARITAYYRSPDDLTLETRPEGERHFEVAGKFGSLTSAMRAAQGVLS